MTPEVLSHPALPTDVQAIYGTNNELNNKPTITQPMCMSRCTYVLQWRFDRGKGHSDYSENWSEGSLKGPVNHGQRVPNSDGLYTEVHYTSSVDCGYLIMVTWDRWPLCRGGLHNRFHCIETLLYTLHVCSVCIASIGSQNCRVND